MIIESLVQGSPEWHEYRKTHIMATHAPIIMGKSKWSTPRDLFLEMAGLNPPKPQNGAMRRGLELEPIARDLCCELLKIDLKPVVMQSDFCDFMSASLDGWNAEKKVLVEIKCPGLQDHTEARFGNIPEHYKHQLVHQMLVANAEEGYYASYRPNDRFEKLVLVRLKFEQSDYDELLEEELKFYRRLQSGDCP